MSRSDERVILFVDLTISSQSRKISGITPISATDLATHLEKIFKNGLAIRKSSNAEQSTYISNVSIDKARKVAKILVNKCDKRTADPTFTDPEKQTRRQVNKKPGEGDDRSAHIIIHLKPQDGLPNTYLMLLELATGLSVSALSPFINQILREHAARNKHLFQVDHPDGAVDNAGNRIKVNYTPKIQLAGHLSEDLINEINNGKLKDIEMITDSKVRTPWDSSGKLVETRQSIYIGVNKHSNSPLGWLTVKQVLKTGKSKLCDQARIHYKNEHDTNRTALIELQSDANDIKLIRKEVLSNFKDPLQSSYEDFHRPLINKMMSFIPR